MNFLYSDGPIIACSTGTNANSAMAVIRISGFKSLSQFNVFFTKDLTGPIEPRKVYFTSLVLQGQFIDDVCITFFEGPKSYNGENILEISVHGNMLNVERILGLFQSYAGCRLASAGEFTYRALKNKKIDLSQVEGLDLFLNAQSGYALEQGLSLLSGNLHDTYLELYDLFLIHKSSLELSIDFSDDIGEEAARDYYLKSLDQFSSKFSSLVKRVGPMGPGLLQPEIVLAGLPNSGKSSFFNFLLSDERAIVSSTAGTTRDYLTEFIKIGDVRYKLIDTAGIRESSDLIEAEGVRRSKSKLTNAFYRVLLINPFEISTGFDDLLKNEFDLILFTHSDVPGFGVESQKLIIKYPYLGSIGAIDLIRISQDWENYFFDLVNKKYLTVTSDKPILLERHKQLILLAEAVLKRYQALAPTEADVAILSHELNTLGSCISEILGIVSPDQVLNSIFSNFCIGK
jgi:tRNA modification GTPase